MQLDYGGVATRVFSRATTGEGDVFVLPAESGRYNGKLVLQAVPTPSGTITAIVVKVELSLDAGVTYGDFATAIDLQTGPKQVDVGGLGAGALLRVESTTFTLGTATGIDIYAIAG
jgi:hypothetical protein